MCSVRAGLVPPRQFGASNGIFLLNLLNDERIIYSVILPSRTIQTWEAASLVHCSSRVCDRTCLKWMKKLHEEVVLKLSQAKFVRGTVIDLIAPERARGALGEKAPKSQKSNLIPFGFCCWIWGRGGGKKLLSRNEEMEIEVPSHNFMCVDAWWSIWICIQSR